ncbi:hypothetical protein [Planobispora takensis]|uniref:Histidine kinase/HSP90-like ATPase domain-containing protein n=1 Tax=Planobispora takensis TaxID=1367882 RepID=A0A8J3WWV3_9ACTN|nr:hypothetical protein [Planobispora takensis]GII05349.1 hypothetical protein Pta02_73570 [Planobispora takensis]
MIESIAYFCTAELLANTAKHSRARQAAVTVSAHGGVLRITVHDDGAGGGPSGQAAAWPGWPSGSAPWTGI